MPFQLDILFEKTLDNTLCSKTVNPKVQNFKTMKKITDRPMGDSSLLINHNFIRKSNAAEQAAPFLINAKIEAEDLRTPDRRVKSKLIHTPSKRSPSIPVNLNQNFSKGKLDESSILGTDYESQHEFIMLNPTEPETPTVTTQHKRFELPDLSRRSERKKRFGPRSIAKRRLPECFSITDTERSTRMYSRAKSNQTLELTFRKGNVEKTESNYSYHMDNGLNEQSSKFFFSNQISKQEWNNAERFAPIINSKR